MKEYVFRLTKGQELKTEIKKFCDKNNITAGFIASGVGSLLELKIRDADGIDIHTIQNNLEIVSLTGTVSKNRIHIHISCSKKDLSVLGGHLVEAKVNTTCEVIIISLDTYEFLKKFDENTGYNELDIKQLTKIYD